MEVEKVFTGPTKVITKSYGMPIHKEAGSPDDELYVPDDYAPQDAKLTIFSDSKFVTIGKATFLVGIPQVPYAGMLWDNDLDNDAIKDDDNIHDPKELWIPLHEILSIIPASKVRE